MEPAIQPTAAAVSRAADFYVGSWLVQPRLCTASCATASSRLEPKAMEVLIRLAAHAGEVISKDELIGAVWPDTFVGEDVLTHAIWRLRQTFGNGDFIQTIPRRGYRLVAPVRPVVAPIRSLAVLPLMNLSGDAEQEYFAAGMTDALISAIAQVGGLRMISATSALRYKGSDKPLPQIAAELGVEGVIEGAVSRAGERVRVSVQLIRAANDEHIWAKTYDRNLRDVLELQDEVARAIAEQIQVTLTPDEQHRLTRRRSVNPIAQELYLRGRYWYLRLTPEGMQRSVEYNQQAIAADPEFALAYAGLADPLAMLSSPVACALPPTEAIPVAFAAVYRALELDPALPQAHRELGWGRLHWDWDWAAAERELKQALALNPSYGDGYQCLSELYSCLLRHEDPVAAAREACRYDPLSLISQSLLGLALILAGRMKEAAAHLQSITAFEPGYPLAYVLLSLALSHTEQYDQAVDAAETAARLSLAPFGQTLRAYALGRAGRVNDARQIVAKLQTFAATNYLSPMLSAIALVAVGEVDSALDCLDKCYAIREPYACAFLRTFPTWEPLHAHPRFQDLVRRMNFPE